MRSVPVEVQEALTEQGEQADLGSTVPDPSGHWIHRVKKRSFLSGRAEQGENG